MNDDLVERLRAGAWANKAAGAGDHAADLSDAANVIKSADDLAETIENVIADLCGALARYREARRP